MNTEFRSENLTGREHLRDLDVDGKTILQWIFKVIACQNVAGFICFKKGTSDRLY